MKESKSTFKILQVDDKYIFSGAVKRGKFGLLNFKFCVWENIDLSETVKLLDDLSGMIKSRYIEPDRVKKQLKALARRKNK
jgi:hypothetical protein